MADKLVIMLLTIEPDHPHLCGTPFFQAAAAAAMGFEVEIYFASRAVRLLVKGVADRIYPSDNRVKSVYKLTFRGEEVLEIRGKLPNGKVREVKVTADGKVVEVH